MVKTNSKQSPKKTEEKPKKKTDRKAQKNKKRQKKSVEIAVQNMGKLNIEKQMIEAGYSFSYARKGQAAHTRSESFRKKIDRYLSEEDILITLSSLKNSRNLDQMQFPTEVTDEEIQELLASVNAILRKVIHGSHSKYAYFWSADNRARKDALDMACKIRGLYAPEKIEDVSKSQFSELTDEQLASRKKEIINFLKKKE